jgi:hypothetical protein
MVGDCESEPIYEDLLVIGDRVSNDASELSREGREGGIVGTGGIDLTSSVPSPVGVLTEALLWNDISSSDSEPSLGDIEVTGGTRVSGRT